MSDYVRSIDFTQPASRATGVTFAAPVTGGPAVQGAFQQNITPANTGLGAAAGNLDHAVGLPQGRGGQQRDRQVADRSAASDTTS